MCCRRARTGAAMLAREIARDLFTSGRGDRAERLSLIVDGEPERDVGGWSERSVVDRIETALLRGRYHR